MATVATFEVSHTQFLNALGEAASPLPDFAQHPAQLIPLYRAMVLARTFDAKAIALQRTGKLGTYASFLGQEAVAIGVAAAMHKEDVLLPTYRETALLMQRGVTMRELLTYWSGDERGSDFAVPREDFPICITIAAQCCHAVGIAYAVKFRKQARAVVCLLGDGATSKGDFYEAMNAAGVWKLPVVFVVANNQWAISVPLASQTAAATLAQKSIAAGFGGEQVDGNDVVAVRHIVGQALDRARNGAGPTLVEAVTYRLSDHTTADDASRYRDAKELSRQWALEPILRLRNYLSSKGAWNKNDEEALLKDSAEQVRIAVEEAQAFPAPRVEALFSNLYAALPASLAWQQAEALHQGARHG
jgi:2-oxoisovalerate dehydrogenase E1 component alpha subunit